MQLISLNTWGGRVPAIDSFVEKWKDSTDIFCFQEVTNGAEIFQEERRERPHLFQDLKKVLQNFEDHFCPHIPTVGLATFVRKGIPHEGVGASRIFSAEELSHFTLPDGRNYYPRDVLSLKLKEPHISIYNFHGIPGFEKKDTREREIQTDRLLEVLSRDTSPKIAVGDFNLNPDTEAIGRMENILLNLVKERGVATTRSSFYKRKDELPFADYCFVSPELKVNDFQVLPDEVSDHLPLLLVF